MKVVSILALLSALFIMQGILERAKKRADDWEKIALQCGETLETATTLLNRQNAVMETVLRERDWFHKEREEFYERKPHSMTNGYVMVTIRNIDDWPSEPVYVNSNGTPLLTATGLDWEIEIHP